MTDQPTPVAPLGTAGVPALEEGPRIYIACLAAYNSGILHGRWIAATMPDEVQAEVRTMLAESPVPEAEEWAIHDHEGFEDVSVSDYASFESVCDLATFD